MVTQEEFLKYFPQYTFVNEKLVEENVPYAIFAGSEVWLLTNSRVPTDLDILVKDEDLDRVSALFNQEIQTKQKGGVSADYILIDNVELVARIKIQKEGQLIAIALNDEMIQKRLMFKLNDALTLPLLPPEDTMIIKALLKRGESEGKFDLEDINSLKSKIDLDEVYLSKQIDKLEINQYVKFLLD